MRTQIKRVVRVLAAVVCFAPPVVAQNQQTAIGQSELRRSGAGNLYDALAALRPDWLSVGTAREPVLVFLNGQHVGTLEAARDIETARVIAVRLRSTEYVRSTIPRFPREEFAAAIFVSTRAEPVARQGRVTLSLDAGYTLLSVAQAAQGALREQGYTKHYADGPGGGGMNAQEGTVSPMSLGATAHYAVRRGWGAGLIVNYTLEGRVGAQDPDRHLEAVTTRMTSAEAAVVATLQGRVARLSAGPAFRRVNWTWTDGFSESSQPEKNSSTAIGLATDLALALPIGNGRAFPQLKVLGRYYPSQSTAFSEMENPLQVGGLVATMGVGIATRF